MQVMILLIYYTSVHPIDSSRGICFQLVLLSVCTYVWVGASVRPWPGRTITKWLAVDLML